MPEAWLWGVNGPDFMDALGLMASQPRKLLCADFGRSVWRWLFCSTAWFC